MFITDRKESNIFRSICNSVHRTGVCIQGDEGVFIHGGVGSVSRGWRFCFQGVGQTPPGLPQEGLHPGGFGETPLGLPQEGGRWVDPPVVTSSGGPCSSRYASYWNAFLFMFVSSSWNMLDYFEMLFTTSTTLPN